ncbi:MAG: FAD-dependent oxidoreductase [Spirochaetales bacterium]|nr:FAD-dependent oxidoreductase [Spirochaetales bacterium]
MSTASEYDAEVIVVGAGFAGVTAARELSRAGRSVLIIEGRDRVGGRTWRVERDGRPFELGGAYVHWLQPHLIAELTRYGLGLTRDDGEGVGELRILSGGTLRTYSAGAGYALLGEAYEALYAASGHPDELFPYPYDPLSDRRWHDHAEAPLADLVGRLDLSEIHRDALAAMLATDVSASIRTAALVEMVRLRSLVGSDDFSKLADVAGTYTIRGGTEALLASMLRDGAAELHLQRIVTGVRRTDEAVSVRTTEGAVYRAETLILAVPLNTWTNIAFDPPLSEAKRVVSEARHAGGGFKCFIRVSGRRPGVLAVAPEPHPVSFLTTLLVEDAHTWMVAFGPAAPREFSVPWAREAVRALIPEAEATEVYGWNWTGDPLSLGIWATFRPAQGHLLSELVSPEGRIVFAGSDIAVGWRGYIDGAIESGLRAARAVLRRS